MRNLIFLLFIIFCISCSAQKEVGAKATASNIMITSKHEPKPLALWTFTKKKLSEPNQYMIVAELNLAQHWHIFDFEPGGDGLLIAPAFSFDDKSVEIIKKDMVGTLITSELSGIGNVRYYENQVRFEILVRSKQEEIIGSVYYQLCDEQKCMAPTEKPFNLK